MVVFSQLTASPKTVYHKDAMKQPIIGLAPIDSVTDASNRTMHGLYGRPDVVLAEFTNFAA